MKAKFNKSLPGQIQLTSNDKIIRSLTKLEAMELHKQLSWSLDELIQHEFENKIKKASQ